jgi:hypothetical protein
MSTFPVRFDHHEKLLHDYYRDHYREHCREYSVRVRGTVYLWGSAGITEKITFGTPLLLHVRNDISGEEITFGTETVDGVTRTYGTLQCGECVSVPIQNIRGVFATCALESMVCCVIKT